MWLNICTEAKDNIDNLDHILGGLKSNIFPFKKNIIWWIMVENSECIDKVKKSLCSIKENTPPTTFESIGYPVIIMIGNKNVFLDSCNHGYVYFCHERDYPHPFLVNNTRDYMYGPSLKLRCVDRNGDQVNDKEYLGQYLISRSDIGDLRFGNENDFITKLESKVSFVSRPEGRTFYKKNQ